MEPDTPLVIATPPAPARTAVVRKRATAPFADAARSTPLADLFRFFSHSSRGLPVNLWAGQMYATAGTMGAVLANTNLLDLGGCRPLGLDPAATFAAKLSLYSRDGVAVVSDEAAAATGFPRPGVVAVVAGAYLFELDGSGEPDPADVGPPAGVW